MKTNNKLREACANIAEYARSAMCHTTDTHVLGYLNQIEGWAKAALAEPVKNCDVGTAREQEKRHKEEVCPKSACPKHEGFVSSACKGCFAMWSQMPYKEGGAE